MAYKVFTNGSVLQASEINDNLMNQAVATFSNAAARTAAITSPVEGQVTYLVDVDRYDHWTGSAWVSPFGLTLLNSTPFTAQSSVTVNNVFSATYDNYVVELYLTQNTSASDSTWTLVNGGTPAASNWAYNTLVLHSAATAANTSGSAVATPGTVPASAAANFTQRTVLFSPFRTVRTIAHSESFSTASGFGANDSRVLKAQLNNTTSYEGFRFSTTAGTITGNIRIYGVRN